MGTIALYESGSYVGAFGPYVAGDRFRVSLASGTVRYWRNNTLLYTSARVASYPLRVGTALFTTGATVSGLTFVLALDNATWDGQSGRDVVWTNVTNVTANGNTPLGPGQQRLDRRRAVQHRHLERRWLHGIHRDGGRHVPRGRLEPRRHVINRSRISTSHCC